VTSWPSLTSKSPLADGHPRRRAVRVYGRKGVARPIRHITVSSKSYNTHIVRVDPLNRGGNNPQNSNDITIPLACTLPPRTSMVTGALQQLGGASWSNRPSTGNTGILPTSRRRASTSMGVGGDGHSLSGGMAGFGGPAGSGDGAIGRSLDRLGDGPSAGRKVGCSRLASNDSIPN
jgi:hypothetical protein